MNSPNYYIPDSSSLPESENIPSNSSFASKKILDVIFYFITSMKKNFLLSKQEVEKIDILQSLAPSQKQWFRRQKAALSENVYRITIAQLFQKLWANNSNNYWASTNCGCDAKRKFLHRHYATAVTLNVLKPLLAIITDCHYVYNYIVF